MFEFINVFEFLGKVQHWELYQIIELANHYLILYFGVKKYNSSYIVLLQYLSYENNIILFLVVCQKN